MTKAKIYGMPVPKVSQEFAHDLARRFRVLAPKPGVKHEDLLYNAGQQSVVEFVQKCATGATPLALDPVREKSVSVLERVLGVFHVNTRHE